MLNVFIRIVDWGKPAAFGHICSYFHISSPCVSASSAKKKKKAKKVSDEEVGVSGVKSADVCAHTEIFYFNII